jgi:hypothetical protein
MHSAAISNASQMLAKEIDKQLLEQWIGRIHNVFDIMDEYGQAVTWKDFVK